MSIVQRIGQHPQNYENVKRCVLVVRVAILSFAARGRTGLFGNPQPLLSDAAL